MQAEIQHLFESQTTQWGLAHQNFADLQKVETKKVHFNDYDICVQFNPARIRSSGAKTDAKTISERKCFLCSQNRPAEQEGIAWKDYTILINPFPIFEQHFTIPKVAHTDQEILPYFMDMLDLAKDMNHWAVFYNGPQCGASAPDHMHFQACTKDALPLIGDYSRMKAKNATLVKVHNDTQLFRLDNYLRTVYTIETKQAEDAFVLFRELYDSWCTTDHEPMMNIVCTHQEEIGWTIHIIPRAAFRPWQYTAEGDKQLLVSPATVEMAGIFITPIREHFERISKDDIQDILTQCGK